MVASFFLIVASFFRRWERGFPALPSKPEVVALYLAELADAGLRLATPGARRLWPGWPGPTPVRSARGSR